MNERIEKIHYDWLTCPTGDPFADAGGYALNEFSKRFPNDDILQLIERVTDIYVRRWNGKLNPFFLNSKITQPAFNNERKIEETNKYFLSLINEEVPFIKGRCRIIGQETCLFEAGRDNTVLTGSGTFVNFHHTFQTGIMLSKEAIIRFFFLPLASVFLQGRIAVIQSNNHRLSELFSSENCSKNLAAISNGISGGVLKSECKAVGTALFRFADNVINQKKLFGEQNDSLSLYLFTNFGASPEITIYTMPSEVFNFYRFTQRAQYREQWNAFVNSYYSNSEYKMVKYDEMSGTYDAIEKGKQSKIDSSEFQYWRNYIYEKILRPDESILKELLKWSRTHLLDLKIIELYETKVRNMKKETISKINQMADFILQSNDESGIKKAIKKLDAAKNSYMLRRFVIKDIVAKYYNENNEGVILTVEEYAEYLFPDTESWKEVRDVLLIAIYQKLHESNIVIETELEDDDNVEN